MKNIQRLIFPIFLLASLAFFWGSKKEKERPGGPSMAPYDHFMQIRSWPDRQFSAEAFAEKGREIAQKMAERNDPCQPGAKWSLEGPGNISGRCNVIKACPDNPDFLLAGFATGGIYKSIDGGASWKLVSATTATFAYAVADFSWKPGDPNTIWAAMGDPNISSYPSTNSGILKSTDGGETWKGFNNGLGFTVNAKIIAHPTNPNEIWWASMGSPFKRDQFRGVFKSTDGGATWEKKLYASSQAGAIDLVMNPQNPQIMFAATWDRIRTNSESLIGGPNTKIWRTTNGGQNWTKLTNGLPTFTTSRPGLIMSPTNPDKIYAVFADSTAKFLGIWKTADGGNSWAPINTTGLANAFVDFGWYFCKIRLDPANDERLYCLGLNIFKRSLPDNGFSTDVTVHPDVHDLVFRPDGSRLVGCDGGIYHIPTNSTASTRITNLPTTQFYHVAWNPHKPNNYYGGSQDNGTMHGNLGIFNAWPSVFGGDGFRSAFHPIDPKTYYFETQNGSVHGTSNSGQNWNSIGSALGTTDRSNWDTPYIMSPHDPAVLYGGTFKVYKNTTGPAFLWQAVSPDLTDGNIFGARFHTVSTIDESPLEAGRLAAGTSDGNVWVKTAQGAWANVTAGLPDRYITQVRWSATVKDRLFASMSGYRVGEYEAKLYRSDDLGATWQDLVGSDWPFFPVNDFLVMPNTQDSVIAVATDWTVWLSVGKKIQKSIGSNSIGCPIFDLELDTVNRRIIAGSWGRGIWTYPMDSLNLGFAFSRKTVVSVRNPANLPVPGVKINTYTVTTEPDGNFYTSDNTCADAKYQVSKKTEPLAGISTFDLVAMSKHILNVVPFTQPWQFIAADINKNKQVTTYDIVELRKLILGIYADFPANTSWRFYPKNFVFTSQNPAEENLPDTIRQFISPTVDTTFFEFTGVKIGDVNNDWMPFSATASDRNVLEIFTKDRDFEAGEVFEAEFSASTAGLVAGQFTLGFDKKMLEIESVEPLLPGMTGEFFGTNRLGDGLLTGCFLLENRFGFSEKIFRAKFRSIKKGSLKTALQLTDWPTASRGFSPEGIENQAVISFEWVLAGPFWRFSQNPVSDGPVFLLNKSAQNFSENQMVELTVFDAAGRFVFSEKQTGFEDGQVRFPSEKLPSGGGLFFVKINAAGANSQTLHFVKT